MTDENERIYLWDIHYWNTFDDYYKSFRSGNSQAVRIPKEFQFDVEEIEIFRRDDEIVLRKKPDNLADAFELLASMPDDFSLKDVTTHHLNSETLVIPLKYLLDTDICIYIAKKRPPKVFKRFAECQRDEIGMSLITYGELRCGANKSQHRELALTKLDELKQRLAVLAMAPEVAIHYGKIRAQLEQKGIPIGNNDLWIAAHAMALDVTVVTNNTSEFERIDNLRVENWVFAEDE